MLKKHIRTLKYSDANGNTHLIILRQVLKLIKIRYGLWGLDGSYVAEEA